MWRNTTFSLEPVWKKIQENVCVYDFVKPATICT